jgi:hypothetical protein
VAAYDALTEALRLAWAEGDEAGGASHGAAAAERRGGRGACRSAVVRARATGGGAGALGVAALGDARAGELLRTSYDPRSPLAAALRLPIWQPRAQSSFAVRALVPIDPAHLLYPYG